MTTGLQPSPTPIPPRLPPPPSPFRSAPPRPLTCCHPNVPHPGQQVHPTLAALAEAVRPGRRQATASSARSLVEPAPAEQNRLVETSSIAELPAASHADEPLAIPRSTSEARPRNVPGQPRRPAARPAGRAQHRPLAAMPAETHPLRSMNGPATIPEQSSSEHPSASEAQPLRPSPPRNFQRPFPPRSFAAPQTAPLESREPTELPHDVESKVIQPVEDAKAPASKTARPDATEAKVINNPWAKREEQAAAKHSGTAPRCPNPSAWSATAMPKRGCLAHSHQPPVPGNMPAAPSHKPARQSRRRQTGLHPSMTVSRQAATRRSTIYVLAFARRTTAAARGSEPVQRPTGAVDGQSSEDESEPNPLRGRLPRPAYPSGHWAVGNPLR